MRLFRYLVELRADPLLFPGPSRRASARGVPQLRTYLVAASSHLQGWGLILASLSEAERPRACLEELEAGAPLPGAELPRVLQIWRGAPPALRRGGL